MVKPAPEARQATLAALHEGGPAQLAALLERLAEPSAEALRKRLQRLKAAGLVELVGGRWTITAPGVALVSTAARPASGALLEHPGWAPLLAALPTPEHRAALRLGAAVALAKATAGERLGLVPWLGVAGPPGTGKSLLGRLLLAVLGGQELSAPTAPAGEILGRRTSGAGGVGFEPSPLLTGPVALVDELDKAPAGAMGAYVQLLEGRPTIKAEGRDHPHRAGVVATWNPTRGDLPLPEGPARRSIVFDTSRMADRLRRAFQVEDRAQAALSVVRAHPGPWVEAGGAAAVARAAESDGEALRRARALLFDLATAEGREAGDAGVLPALAAGYAALGFAAAVAVAEALADLCMVRATRAGLVLPEWAARVGELRAAAAPVAGWALERPTEPDPDELAARRQLEHAAALRFEAARGGLLERVQRLREACDNIHPRDPDRRENRGKALGVLRAARRHLEAAASMAHLGELAPALLPALDRTERWIVEESRRIEGEQRQAQARRDASSRAREHRAWAKALRRAARGGDQAETLAELARRGLLELRTVNRGLKLNAGQVAAGVALGGLVGLLTRSAAPVMVAAKAVTPRYDGEWFDLGARPPAPVRDLAAWLLARAALEEQAALELERFAVGGQPVGQRAALP